MAWSWADGLSVLPNLALVALLALGLCLAHRRWWRRQEELARTSSLMKRTHACSLALAKRFLPSFRAARYQFRGMQAKAGGIGIAFRDLSLQLPNGTSVLKGVAGEFKAGRMAAVMGPSGSGKTTFLNVLCGKVREGTVSGSVLVNGETADLSEFRSVIGFVPQDDVVYQDLTVREQIHFSARLRNDVSVSDERIELITEDVLNIMQIEHIQNSIVGSVEKRGISGGQRKRVNIGLELAAQPSVLFLDEPTSGLDSTSSLMVAKSLTKLCQLGVTTIAAIHQPRYSLFALFDDVLLLGRGKTVYSGPSLGVYPYFQHLGFEIPPFENAADWFMDVISGDVENKTIENFKPELLPDLWDEKGRTSNWRSSAWAQGVQRQRSGQLDADEWLAFNEAVEDEWPRLSLDGQMRGEELHGLLLPHCPCKEAAAAAAAAIVERAAGKGAQSATMVEFLSYLSNLVGFVAHDRLSLPPDAKGHGHCSLPKEGRDLESCSSSFDSGQSSADGFAGLERDLPGFRSQLLALVLRRIVQTWRMNKQRAIFLSALTLGAIFFAALDKYLVPKPVWDATALLFLHTVLALLLAIFSLHVFGNDRLMFWRESASGVSVPAFFVAHVGVNSFDVVVQTVLFTSVYFLIRQPMVPYWCFLPPFLLTAYAASAWGYLISTLAPPRHGPFMTALAIFVICVLLGYSSNLSTFLNGGVMEFVTSSLSITRWSVALSFNFILQRLPPEDVSAEAMGNQEWFVLQRQLEVYDRAHWDGGYFLVPTLMLLAIGFYLHVGSFLGLRFGNRSQQA